MNMTPNEQSTSVPTTPTAMATTPAVTSETPVTAIETPPNSITPNQEPIAATAAVAATEAKNISINKEPEIDTIMEEAPQVEEKVDKEKEMAELLITMDNYTPIIPDAVIDYYLNKTGFDCDDVRIKKLFALAAQKFVADIATDAFQFNRVKQSSRNTSKSNKEKKTVLTMDDLSSALAEYGVNVKKPDYYN